MKNDFDFIKEKFDADVITSPAELDAKVERKLSSAKMKRVKFSTNAFRATLSIVACMAILLTGITVSQMDNARVEPSPEPSNIITFSDYGEIKDYVKACSNSSFGSTIFNEGYDAVTVKAGDENMIVDADSASTSSVAPKGSYANTYTQVESIDEADIIKTYGNRIFTLHQSVGGDELSYCVEIFEVNGKSVKKVGRIDFPEFKSTGSTSEWTDAFDMFVYKDRLVVNTTVFKETENTNEDSTNIIKTRTVIYDISDCSNPDELYSFAQSGNYVSSRMIGNTLYVISNYNIYYNEVYKNDKDYAPTICENDGRDIAVEPSCIGYVEDGKEPCYIVASSIDVEKGNKTDTKAMLGAGWNIYCNMDNLYIVGGYWKNNDKIIMRESDANTRITKLSLKDGLEFKASGTVKGIYDDQYSFNEKDGCLCVCTTYTDKEGNSRNRLFVLDENLKEIAKTSEFANGESIKAVKYIGDMAYVITYEETDPLFVIDLSDIKKPKILGEVKISGFSSMLVDVGNNQLLGVGYSTHQGDGIEITDGLKLVLFDVSDPLNPKVLSTKVFNDTNSAAQYSPLAFVQNKDKGYYMIPFYHDSQIGAITIEIKNDKIEITNTFNVKSNNYGDCRATYVDDYIYVIDAWNYDIFPFKAK